MEEFEKFYAKVRRTGDSLAITIPYEVVEYAGYKEGDLLKVMTRKKTDEE